MKKRIIALLIVCVLLVSLVPVVPTLAYGSSSVDLPRNNVVGETVTVTADGAGCQWQIKIGEVWVNISGATSPSLTLSYAMFANIPGAPVIRCIDASGNAASDEIVVNFVDAVEPATKPAPAPEVITQPVVDAVITEPSGTTTPAVQQPVVEEPVVEEPVVEDTPVDTAALEQALADAQAADEAAQAAATAANAEAEAKKAVLDAAQAEYDAAAAVVADAQAALDASIVPVEEGQEPAPLDAELSAALSTAQLTAADAEAKLTAAQADYDAAAAVAAEANAAAADTAAAVAAAQAALDAAAATPAVVEETTAPAAPKLKMASFNLAKTTSNEIATVDDTTGDTLNTYNVVINYVFENNAPVADSYTAQLAAGSNFSANVTFPTVQGYLPYLDNVQQNSYAINITNIQASVTYTVVYKPTDVDYTVIHYQQNVDNDNYTEAARETLTGETDSTVPDVAKNYSGFYALLYERPTIAADGSTVVEIYYDRNYYLMNFELDGGYGTEPVYARYGAPIEVTPPTKAGYTFKGWLDSEGNEVSSLPLTMPAQFTSYKANWTAGTASIMLVFWYENADDDNYSSVGNVQVDGLTAGQTVTSETYKNTAFANRDDKNFTYNSAMAKSEVVAGDGSTVLNIYFTRNEYTLTFVGDLLTCTKVEHEHSHEECCTKSGLMHGLSCNTNKCPNNGEEHSHNSNCYEEDANILTVTAKYDSDITNIWSEGVIKQMLDQGYVFKSSVTDKYYSFLEKMPEQNITMTATLWSGDTYTWYYYLEVLPGQDTTGLDIRENGGRTYYRYDTTVVKGEGLSLTYAEDYYPITGFTQRDNSVPEFYNYVAYLYYIRNSYDLSFVNYGDIVDNEGGTFLFEADISDQYFTPEYPSTLEEGAYVFDGWYTSPFFGDTKFEFTTNDEDGNTVNATMPAKDLTLYAKWVPVTHTVQFYLDKEAYDAGTELTTHPAVTVPHGEKIDPIPEDPKNGSYDFVEWFYIDDEGKEAAFNFENMPIRQDLKVYAKWSSNVLRPYTVYFKIQGTDTQIADPIESSGVAGHTKTFDAKANEELYTNYQEGYFPIVTSHSMTLSIEGDNTFTFEYVKMDAVPYTVYYVSESDAGGTRTPVEIDGKTYYIVADTKNVTDNRKAVVTETFKVVPGMMPDAYQRRLILNASDPGANKIVFIYTEDSVHAYYKITHYTEDVSGTGWTEYASSQAVGDINSTYSADSMTITGFTFDPGVEGTKQSGVLTADGLELKLYYTRNPYPYIVKYAENGTGKELAPDKTGTAKYGTVHTEDAITIADYTVVEPASQSITIKVEESSTEAKVNVIIFYYEQNEVKIEYKVVGPENCGTLTKGEETLKILTGEAQGSQAIPAENFRFVGWYTDEACTQPVDANLVDANNKFVPAKVDGKNVAATYYAKFEYDVTTLTITKTGAQDRGYGPDGFIFNVKDPNGTIVATVAISGNGSTTIGGLKVGTTYTVSEVQSWSHRYTCADQSVTLVPNGNEVIMANSYSATNILNGGDSVTNRP